MNTDVSNRLDATFLALADPTRRAILARLTVGEASVTELAAPFTMSQPAVSKHLKILERIEGKPLAEARAWLEQYRDIWEASFERLDRLLEELQTRPAKPRRPRKRKKR